MFFDNSILLPRVSLHPSMDALKERDRTVSQANTQRTGDLSTDLQSLSRPQRCPHHLTFYPYGLSGLVADLILLMLRSFWHRAAVCFF